MSNLDFVLNHLTLYGPITAVRVSSAQARGRAARFPYWGAVRYVIRPRKRDGVLCAIAEERASSDRRPKAGALRDANAIAAQERRYLYKGGPGKLSLDQVEQLVRHLHTKG